MSYNTMTNLFPKAINFNIWEYLIQKEYNRLFKKIEISDIPQEVKMNRSEIVDNLSVRLQAEPTELFERPNLLWRIGREVMGGIRKDS